MKNFKHFFITRYTSWIFLLGILFLPAKTYCQNLLFDQNQYSKAIELSLSGNSYNFMELRNYIGSLNSLLKKSNNDDDIINLQIKLIDNLIKTSQQSKYILNNKFNLKDSYLGWVATSVNSANNNTLFMEVPLFESYVFFYVTEFLYIIKSNNWISKSKNNYDWWRNTLNFIEQNIWTKWRERSYLAHRKYNRTFLRSRTHMGSHWAGIAQVLYLITPDPQVKSQCLTLVSEYDILLKRNLKVINNRYVWNSTYNDVRNTDAEKININKIQDAAHANHVISYVILAHELRNNNWKRTDIVKFCKTLEYIYNKHSNSFRENVDGTTNKKRLGSGNIVGDGWVKLSKYCDESKTIFMNFIKNEKLLKRNNQKLILMNNLLSL
ncbi:hypothetical protein [Sphingobacterium sp. SGL-16]|uniref:hypothetical protein n=1 Tax=Sphingobacterium sp. SGL-16 TaxID=2710883 RepID=UPI0013ED0A73|nr:hypothetical protein [Sphingobacterium sp. SGL-16]NGM73069.1 hypothetical protein [Sphingobacterium sp. SGL-16]